MRSGNRDRKFHNTVLEDSRAWVEQLWAEHGVMCAIQVAIPPADSKIPPGVILELTRPHKPPTESVVYRDWQAINGEQHDAVEAAVLQLVSKALLEMDREVERAAQRPLFA